MSKQERLPFLLLLLPPSSILLFLCPKDCLSLSGPSKLTGIVGESLTVPCSYDEEYKTKKKYWCRKKLYLLCDTIMDTQKVSIRDHPENQTLTMTIENLTEADAGKYKCVIEKNFLDDSFTITIIVSPAYPVAPNRYSTTSPTDIPVTDINEIGGEKTSKENSDPIQLPRSGILDKPGVLLLILGLLIISLVGALFLVWRMIMRQKKVAEKSVVFLDSNQPNNEVCYENLERPSNQDPLIQSSPNVEHSTVIAAQEESVTYSLLTFPMDNQKTVLETQEYLEGKTVYSIIKKT